MNEQKLKDYQLIGSIHTLSVRSENEVTTPEILPTGCIKHSRTDGITTAILNPNKLMGDLYTYSDFQTALDTILIESGIKDFDIIRADMRFDSMDREHYHKYAKLNRYLISLLAVTYSVRNSYRATNLFTQKQLSIAIKNRYFECENYDKAEESGGIDSSSARLEERSKDSSIELKREFLEHWSDRWEKALKHKEETWQRYNAALAELYEEDLNIKPCRFRRLTDFVIQYQDCIFCKAQLIDLFSRLGVENPVTRAENHKKRYGIEYFSDKDIRTAVDEIRRASMVFFGS